MKPHRQPFATPYFDAYQVGFALPAGPASAATGLNWRQRTIAGVSWNGQEQQALFFNPDRQALPLEAHPYELPRLLARVTTRREFAAIVSDGQFAMPVAQQKAMTAKMRGQWVTYWFIDADTVYGNTAEVFADYTEARSSQVRDDVASTLNGMADRFWPESLRWSPDAEAGLVEARQAYCVQQQGEAEQDERVRCAEQHAKQVAYDKRVGEWLRGEAGGPPLLALMQGEAA